MPIDLTPVCDGPMVLYRDGVTMIIVPAQRYEPPEIATRSPSIHRSHQRAAPAECAPERGALRLTLLRPGTWEKAAARVGDNVRTSRPGLRPPS
jgi:hypothetical protein